MEDFYDRYGNLLPNSWDEQSENPTTFNVSYYFSIVFNDTHAWYFKLKNNTLEKVGDKYSTNKYTWRTMEYDDNPSWSIDEKISALAFFNYINNRYWIRRIPVFPSFNNSSLWSWLRPDVLAYTLKVKCPWLPIVDWIIALKICKSFNDFRKNPQAESSGVQLAFIMLMGLREFKLIKQEKELIKQAMDIYYPEEDHPVRLAWGEQ